MAEFVQRLLVADFLPHGWCYRWDPGVVWLHVASDLLIALAYYFIPFSLLYIVRRRGDLVYPWMFWLFGAFILACGTTHLMSVVVVWQPWYRLDGFIKLFTALVSVPTAVMLLRLSPAIIALPSPEQLRVLNRQLEQEVADRKVAEAEVRRLNEHLERRVQERTIELSEANRKLTASENRLRAILDGTPMLVYLKDPDDKFLFINRQLETTYNLDRNAVVGRTGAELFPAEAAAAYRAADLQVWADGKVHEFEELGFPGDDTRTYVSVKFPLFDDSGNPQALCGMSADITARKQAEQMLKRYTAELEQFAFVAAHDLQEPLRTVKSYAQLVAKRYRGKLDDDADEFIGYITGGVERMYDLISGLHLYTQAGARPPAVQNANSAAVLRETLRVLETTVREAGASIEFGDLPESVRMSPSQLGQIFQNLISNAIKYRSAQAPAIRVAAVRAGRGWRFSVSDNGIGIDMQYADQIFGVFRRLHGREIPGTGIGLAIVKKIVESNGGTVWVESEPGRGADFFFTVPA